MCADDDVACRKNLRHVTLCRRKLQGHFDRLQNFAMCLCDFAMCLLQLATCRKNHKISGTCRGKSQGHVAKFRRHVAKIKSWDFAAVFWLDVAEVAVGTFWTLCSGRRCWRRRGPFAGSREGSKNILEHLAHVFHGFFVTVLHGLVEGGVCQCSFGGLVELKLLELLLLECRGSIGNPKTSILGCI
jgi:hypothetical protein